jgi:hypothetical protein
MVSPVLCQQGLHCCKIILKFCVLAGNALDGTIPSKLGEMRNIEQLDLSSNQFTGAIPVELSFLTKPRSFECRIE